VSPRTVKFSPKVTVTGALTIHRRAGWQHSVEWCANECRRQSGLPNEATHYALICGYPVLLCAACARAWPRMWAGAVEHPELEPA